MAPAKGVVVISSLATALMCSTVRALTRELCASLRACDTVVTETPAAFATSRMLTFVAIDFVPLQNVLYVACITICKTFCNRQGLEAGHQFAESLLEPVRVGGVVVVRPARPGDFKQSGDVGVGPVCECKD